MRRASTFLRKYAGELATAIALVAGWLLVTLGVARLVRPDVVWPFSLGLLLLAVPGARIIVPLFAQGLYALFRGSDG